MWDSDVMLDCIELAQKILGTGMKLIKCPGANGNCYLEASYNIMQLRRVKAIQEAGVKSGQTGELLKPSKILDGRFGIESTQCPAEHLTMYEKKGKEVIRILNIEYAFSFCYHIHRTGMAS
jgi:hypothetical protein